MRGSALRERWCGAQHARVLEEALAEPRAFFGHTGFSQLWLDQKRLPMTVGYTGLTSAQRSRRLESTLQAPGCANLPASGRNLAATQPQPPEL